MACAAFIPKIDFVKGLGKARRVDEAFHILESVDLGTAARNPRLSPQVIYGLLNAILEAGLFDLFLARLLSWHSWKYVCYFATDLIEILFFDCLGMFGFLSLHNYIPYNLLRLLIILMHFVIIRNAYHVEMKKY